MKKNIIIFFLLLVSGFFVIFSYIKANDVENLSVQLQKIQYEMQQHSEIAAQMQERALNAAADAVKQKREAEMALAKLQECQSK